MLFRSEYRTPKVSSPTTPSVSGTAPSGQIPSPNIGVTRTGPDIPGGKSTSLLSRVLQKASSFGRSVARVAAKPAALNPVGLGATMAMTPSIANAGENEFARQAKYGAKPAASTPATKQAAATPKTTTPAPGPQPKAPPPAPAAASAAASAPKPAAAPAAAPVKQTFGQAFAAARKAAGGAGGTFSYNSKQYQTNIKGEKYSKSPTPVDTAKPSVPTPPSRPAELSAPAAAASAPKPALSSPGVTPNVPKMTLPDNMGSSSDKNVYSVTDVTPKRSEEHTSELQSH